MSDGCPAKNFRGNAEFAAFQPFPARQTAKRDACCGRLLTGITVRDM